MAYCRYGEGSDVYAYKANDNDFSIHLPDGIDYHETSLQAFKARLEQLRQQGHTIPDHTFDRINRELGAADETE